MRFFASVSVIPTMAAVVIYSSNAATASGLGCDNRQDSGPANAISVELTLPYGYLCHLVNNRGKEISVQRAAYTSNSNIYGPLVANICNWQIDFVYYDAKGQEYMRDKGKKISDCKQDPSRILEKNKTLPQYGSTCAELLVDGDAKLIQCHKVNE